MQTLLLVEPLQRLLHNQPKASDYRHKCGPASGPGYLPTARSFVVLKDT